MSIQCIDQARPRVAGVQPRQAARAQCRLILFDRSTFERASAVETGDGRRSRLPSTSDADRVTAGRLFALVPPEERGAVQLAADELADALRNEVAVNPQALQGSGFSTALTTALGNSVTVYAGASEARADLAVQGAIFMGILPLENDLTSFACAIRERTKAASQVHTDLAELREQLGAWPEGTSQEVRWTEVTVDAGGELHTELESEVMTRQQAEALAERLDTDLGTMRDMSELDRIELQDMTEKYNQALSLLSALLKSQHDTLKSIINNLKA